MIKRSISKLADTATCWLMQSMQWTVRHDVCSREQIENYLTQGEKMTREEFLAFAPMEGSELSGSLLHWQSPVRSGYRENDVAAARVFLSQEGWSAPTLFFLHALMSAHDFGYERISRRLNRAGWNAVLVHLPYHYSRIPRGYVNGALALTSNLPRNGETIRQAVKEVRQLLAMFRKLGCGELGLIGTSFGGWIGALVSFLEADLSFLALLQPIADVEHAIWNSPASRTIRTQLGKARIPAGITRRHAHLTSPKDGHPLCDPARILLVGGSFDSIVPLGILRNLQDVWRGSRLIEVAQGHFGYAAMGAALREFEQRRSSDSGCVPEKQVSDFGPNGGSRSYPAR